VDSRGFTVDEAARLLDISRQGVNPLFDTKFPLIADARPKRAGRNAVEEAHRHKVRELEESLKRLRAAATELNVDATEATALPPRDNGTTRRERELQDQIEKLRSEFEAERIGRAVAEARIDTLKQQLRQANRAIDALKPAPDADFDSIAEPS
jgi:predicted RNase H-like nuclease (RuvC/YqgF family)